MGSIIVAVIFIFGFPIAFFIILRSYLRLKKKLKEMSAISEAVFDIDAYAAAKHTEADFYAENKQAEADQAFSAASAKIATLERKIEALTQQRKELSSEVKSLELDVLLGSVRIDNYQNMKSDEIKNELVILRSQQDAQKMATRSKLQIQNFRKSLSIHKSSKFSAASTQSALAYLGA